MTFINSWRMMPCFLVTLAASALVGCGEQGNIGLAFGGSEAAPADGETTAVAKPPTKPKHPANQLARETSPYLLQHAHNPVNWHPWGPEAFAKAKKESKPVFLSIGYSSCYWCHVMERLVFEDEAIAKQMNEQFVCIKVDREERPDIDDIYMTSLIVYLQMIGSRQGGGWPLSMFLTPEGKPIAGGTYFPPETKQGRMGFPDVMKAIDDAWKNHRDGVDSNADIIAKEVRRLMKPGLNLTPTSLKRELVTDAAASVLSTYDPLHGGIDFSPESPNSPKFPTPVKLDLLQYAVRRGDNTAAAKAVDHTLAEIARGGIRDHLAGGFHRYSTDRAWQVPHFEKMLYDQAQLADSFVQAYRRTGREEFRQAAETTYDFVLNRMTSKDGAFHSALDAETDGVEGKHYVWSEQEIADGVPPESLAMFRTAYGLDQPQVFEHGYILHHAQSPEALADQLGMTTMDLEARLLPLRRQLLAVRDRRPALREDDKILTSWNGLVIRSLARAGQLLRREDYTAAAEKAALFILTTLRDKDGRLYRTHRAGQSKLNAYLDDYAFLIEGLLALHTTTKDEKWLNAARRLMNDQIAQFWDETGHGFYFTPTHHEELLVRTKNANDAVLPSGNSVSVRNLIRLASLTKDDSYRKKAEQTLQLFAGQLANRPRGLANMAVALGEYLDDPNYAAASTQRVNPTELAQNEAAVIQIAAETPAPKDGKPEIVTARAYLNVDRLPAGSKCRIVVFIDIQKGWHINQNPAVPENLIPTKVSLKSGQKVTLTDLKYPAGEKLKIPGFDEDARVYEGQIAVYGTLNIPAEAAEADMTEISVRYQPCNDKSCLAPKTVKLNGKVPIATPGQAVKFINQNLFPQ